MRHFVLVVLCLACHHAGAATHSVKPREVVHAYPPTGPVEVAGTVQSSKTLRTMQRYAVPAFTDVLATHIAVTLQGASDAPFTVTRRPRQSGREAAVLVSSAAPDGRTLLLAGDAPMASTSAPPLFDNTRLRLLAYVASMPYVLIASPESSHSNLGELIGKASRSPHKIFLGSVGEQSAGHFVLQRVRSRHGLQLEAVAYNGGHAALQAVVTRQVSVALVPLPSVLPYLGGGRIKAWAIAQSRRHPSIPRVQTTAQAGVEDFEAESAFGIYTQSNTPQSVVDELNAMLSRSPESESARQVFAEFGLRLEHRIAPSH